jgi:hypothetical protein
LLAGTSAAKSQPSAIKIRFCEKGVMRKEDEELLKRAAKEVPELADTNGDRQSFDDLIDRLIEKPPEPKKAKRTRRTTTRHKRQS